MGVWFDLEDDAAERNDAAETSDGLASIDRGRGGRSGVTIIDGAGIAVGRHDGDLGVEGVGVLVEALLLEAAGGDARELRAVKIRVIGKTASASE